MQLSSLHLAFGKRCEQLQVPVWVCDPTGVIASSPPGVEAVLSGISPAAFAQRVQQVISESKQLSRTPVELAPGFTVLFLEEKIGARRTSVTVAMLPSDSRADQLATMLRWSYDDLNANLRDQQTVQQFSERLAQAYEENNLLMRLSRALNCVTQPAELLQMICNQLLETFPFQWMAIRFKERDDEVQELSGRLLLAGKLPCPVEQFDAQCVSLLETMRGDDWTKLLQIDSSPLAALVNSEVISEPITHDDRVIATLLAGNKQGDDPAISSFETQFLDAAASFLGIFHENLARFAEQQAAFIGTVGALTASIDAKDRYTRGHSDRVSHLSALMAQTLKLDAKTVEAYRIAGLVHDVGKIGVPEAVLCKVGRPTDEEFAQIRKHPEIGHEILKDIPKLANTLDGVLHHHERWDGNGYPHKLSGENIPLIARVMALADTFDAISSTRSYRPAITRDKVLAEIIRCAGAQFDPELVPYFVHLDFSEFDQLIEKHSASERFAA